MNNLFSVLTTFTQDSKISWLQPGFSPNTAANLQTMTIFPQGVTHVGTFQNNSDRLVVLGQDFVGLSQSVNGTWITNFVTASQIQDIIPQITNLNQLIYNVYRETTPQIVEQYFQTV